MPGPVLRGRRSGLAALALLALPLAGCSLFGPDYSDVKCPSADVAVQLGSVSRFVGEGGNFADLAYRAQLSDLKGTCDVEDDGVTVHLKLTVLAEIGPAATQRSVDLPYFVAITNPEDRVIAKRVLSDRLSFPPDRQRAGAVDMVDEKIPLRNPRTASNYHLFVGFQLTPSELAYNRAHGG